MPFSATFYAGDSQSATISHASRTPADGWSLQLILRAPVNSEGVNRWEGTAAEPRGGKLVTIDGVATEDNQRWTLTLTASKSKELQPGRYRWALRASKGEEAITIDGGSLRVLPALDSPVTYDDRSDARRILDLIDAFTAGAISRGAAAQISIAGKAITKYSMTELQQVRDKYARRAALENPNFQRFVKVQG